MIYEKYEMAVGLEVHIELSTATKIFCSCPVSFGAPPNSACCPVCMGLPGSLPTLNKKAVEYAVMAGLATNCHISECSGFDRKNYFYPDLPKAYQITQYYTPLCRDGYLDIDTEDGERRIGITRIHLEEDAGKLIHDKGCGTMIDLNRCGVPLIEIVSSPDIHSPAEVKAYLKKLRAVILYTGISDCKMNEGSLRCDVNISVSRKGDTTLGTRCEIKNLNSFNFAAKAVEYEFRRQAEALERGDTVISETRRFDPHTGKTYTMRVKESGEDYRYFPEPDLPPLEVSSEIIEAIRQSLPKLPDERKRQYISDYSLSAYDASVITADKDMSDYFEAAAAHTRHPKILANIMISELLALSAEAESFECPISPSNLASLAELVGAGEINSSVAKKLLRRLWERDEDPREIVKREGLEQIRDAAILQKYAEEAIAQNPRAAEDYRAGKRHAAKAVVGKVMALTQGRADPVLLTEIVEKALS
ncbi:MAG: Asp-tRNA(Asn)/Glu-tRNA(Gln) amidotransferase subunit GatB [Ruminococcaceae bacterium]|nr:Asp-tRNA(Asn)/Glu-tRNA(Gln) amidotransferase subunit GatB [Oscillospiraceae bacterium]